MDIFDIVKDIVFMSACLTYLTQCLVNGLPRPGQAWFDVYDEQIYIVVCTIKRPNKTVLAYNFDTKVRRAFDYRYFTRSRRFHRAH